MGLDPCRPPCLWAVGSNRAGLNRDAWRSWVVGAARVREMHEVDSDPYNARMDPEDPLWL